jgi:DNA-binding CsgD family transcriptional regulator
MCLVWLVREFKKAGYSNVAIADKLNISESSVRKLLVQ